MRSSRRAAASIADRRVGRHDDLAAELAVDLHRDFDLPSFSSAGRSPAMARRPATFVPEDLPEFLGEVGRDGGEQQGEGLDRRPRADFLAVKKLVNSISRRSPC